MHRFALPLPLVIAPLMVASLAGCSSGGLSTASILGNAPTPPAAQAGAPVTAVPSSTATDRAFMVGSVSARAAKCGYNFDANKLKSAYMANEMTRGTASDQLAQVEKVYGIAHNGVMKAASEDPNYCSDRKTQEIKADLTRVLAGDFEPRKVVAQKQEDGFFDSVFGSSNEQSGPKWGSGDWWDKQKDKVGN